MIPKKFGGVVYFIVEEFRSAELSFAFLMCFNMHRAEGDGGLLDQSTQARDEVKAFLSWVRNEIRSKDLKGHLVVATNGHGACGHMVDSVHSRDNHHNANESCCFALGGITILDRSWGDVDSRDAEGGWGVFQDHCGSAKGVFG